jgi:hypothetical protein
VAARLGCRPWSHQYFLRLDDWRVECVHCHRIKREPRRIHRTSRTYIPSSSELDYVKENNVLAIAQRVLKGLAAAVTAAIASYGVAVTDGSVTAEEWITLAVAALGAGLVVWAVPNKVPA